VLLTVMASMAWGDAKAAREVPYRCPCERLEKEDQCRLEPVLNLFGKVKRFAPCSALSNATVKQVWKAVGSWWPYPNELNDYVRPMTLHIKGNEIDQMNTLQLINDVISRGAREEEKLTAFSDGWALLALDWSHEEPVLSQLLERLESCKSSTGAGHIHLWVDKLQDKDDKRIPLLRAIMRSEELRVAGRSYRTTGIRLSFTDLNTSVLEREEKEQIMTINAVGVEHLDIVSVFTRRIFCELADLSDIFGMEEFILDLREAMTNDAWVDPTEKLLSTMEDVESIVVSRQKQLIHGAWPSRLVGRGSGDGSAVGQVGDALRAAARAFSAKCFDWMPSLVLTQSRVQLVTATERGSNIFTAEWEDM